MKFRSVISRLKGSKPLLAVLIDPDKFNPGLVAGASAQGVSCFLVGGSYLQKGDVQRTVRAIRKISELPIVLFPGDETQLSPLADGLLLLSLLSGRNPDYLIEKHISAAPLIRRMKLPHLATAYLLVGEANHSTTRLVTKTTPLKESNSRYIVNTALAASQLGFQAIYLEAGSGAGKPVGPALIRLLKKNVSLPLIVGGGLDNGKKVADAVTAGANMVVIGNALEKNAGLLPELSAAFREATRPRK
jgi:phosphoglycerol geranylgeranyltransferase